MNYQLLSKDKMEKLSAKRLLAYKRKHLTYNWFLYCEACNGWCEYVAEKFAEEAAEWERANKDIRDILSTREHVERKSKRTK